MVEAYAEENIDDANNACSFWVGKALGGTEGKLDQILDDKGQKTHEGFRTTGLDQDWQIWTFHKRALVIPALVCSRWSLASQGGTKPN